MANRRRLQQYYGNANQDYYGGYNYYTADTGLAAGGGFATGKATAAPTKAPAPGLPALATRQLALLSDLLIALSLPGLSRRDWTGDHLQRQPQSLRSSADCRWSLPAKYPARRSSSVAG